MSATEVRAGASGAATSPDTPTGTHHSELTEPKRYDGLVALSVPEDEKPSWTFLTNHAHVLLALTRNPELRQRDLSRLVGITPGAVQKILHDLEDEGYLKREKVGRRNRYQVIGDSHLRHPLEHKTTVADLFSAIET